MAIIIIRTLIIFTIIIISFRVMGKRQLGELEPSELVVAVLISDMAAQPMQDTGTPLLYGLIPVLTLLCCQVLLTGVSLSHLRFSGFLFGKPSMIIKKGKIIQKEMKKNRLSLDELGITLRKKNVSDITTVKYAVLETDGSLSIQLYQSESPVTPNVLGLPVQDPGYPVIVINDGRILSKNLQSLGFNERWLKKQITERGSPDAKDVFYMSVDETGKIFFAAREA